MKTKIRVLHIDDNELDRQLVKDALLVEHDSFEVFEANNRERFEQYLAQNNFDIILSDFNILGFSGLQVLQIVKEMQPETPVIIITGTGTEEIAIQAMKMGAADYVIKKVSHIRGLAHTIELVLQNKKMLDERKINLLLLRENEEKYRYLFENSPQPMWIFDLETLAFLEINDAAIRHYGYTKEEFLSMTIKDIRPAEDVEVLLSKMDQIYNSYTPFGEWRHVKKNGEIIYVEIIYHTLTFKGRKARHVMIIDITKRKHAEQELRKLSRAVEQSSNSILITGTDGTIEYANPIAFKSTGYSPGELMGKKPGIFSSGETSKAEYELLWNTILAGKEWEGEFHNKKKNGELFWESASISPIFDEKGQIIHFLAIKKDVTESKKQTEELIAAKEHAEESDRLKSAFLANMSHEIRTPLNSIIGFSELLGDDSFEPNQKQEFTQNIIVSGNNLLTIINDILDISKIEAGQITIIKTKIQVKPFLDNIIKQHKIKVEDKGISLKKVCLCDDFEHEIIVFTDQNRLLQIFNNLINNALKFTQEGCIEIGCKTRNDVIEFFIKDTGIGIPTEFQKIIFERFRQIENEKTRKYGGNGLGLAITKNLVELMGGKIWVESEEGKGAKFCFTIPL